MRLSIPCPCEAFSINKLLICIIRKCIFLCIFTRNLKDKHQFWTPRRTRTALQCRGCATTPSRSHYAWRGGRCDHHNRDAGNSSPERTDHDQRHGTRSVVAGTGRQRRTAECRHSQRCSEVDGGSRQCGNRHRHQLLDKSVFGNHLSCSAPAGCDMG